MDLFKTVYLLTLICTVSTALPVSNDAFYARRDPSSSIQLDVTYDATLGGYLTEVAIGGQNMNLNIDTGSSDT